MKFKEFLANNREIAQIIYGVVLIILIPLFITINTVTIIQKYNKNIDVTLQRQALVIGRTINTFIGNNLNDFVLLNEQISELVKNNKDIIEANILFPEDDHYIIKVSNQEKNIGEVQDYYYYKIAWSQPLGDALVTDSIKLVGTDAQKVFSIDENVNRFWLTSMPLYDKDNNKIALLSLKISSEIVDELTKNNRNSSIFILIVTIFITILFLIAAVRLWDYAILYKKIKEVDQMKDEFISIASHELRTPITGIKGWSSMIVDGDLGKVNKDVMKGAKIICDSSIRLAVLVDDLLNVSRIEQNRLELSLAPLSPTEVIESTLAELKVQSDAKNLLLKFTAHATPLPLINVDREKFKQVLINLIGNSIKYTEVGQVEILSEEKNKGEILEIKIKDTGIGMSAKARENLFQKFYRIKTEKTEKITGTGLGLWITKQLVELMKGKIMVDSIENVGTQITLQFKIVKAINNK